MTNGFFRSRLSSVWLATDSCCLFCELVGVDVDDAAKALHVLFHAMQTAVNQHLPYYHKLSQQFLPDCLLPCQALRCHWSIDCATQILNATIVSQRTVLTIDRHLLRHLLRISPTEPFLSIRFHRLPSPTLPFPKTMDAIRAYHHQCLRRVWIAHDELAVLLWRKNRYGMNCEIFVITSQCNRAKTM